MKANVKKKKITWDTITEFIATVTTMVGQACWFAIRGNSVWFDYHKINRGRVCDTNCKYDLRDTTHMTTPATTHKTNNTPATAGTASADTPIASNSIPPTTVMFLPITQSTENSPITTEPTQPTKPSVIDTAERTTNVTVTNTDKRANLTVINTAECTKPTVTVTKNITRPHWPI